MRNDQGDQEDPEHPHVARCGHCGKPLLNRRKRAKYCSREHKELARAARKRASDRLTALRRKHPFADATLTELHEQARRPDHWRDDPRNFSDYGDVPGDLDHDDDQGQDDERGIVAGSAPGPREDQDAAWRDRMEFADAVEAIRAVDGLIA
jgi:hypothetical protein